MRYEVGVCINTGWIVWMNGPYPCGDWPDLSIAKAFLHHVLSPGEMYVANGTYRAAQALQPSQGLTQVEDDYMAVCRACHETVSRKFKMFQSIQNTFKREVTKHGLFTHAIANVIQLGIMCEEVCVFDVHDQMAHPHTF